MFLKSVLSLFGSKYLFFFLIDTCDFRLPEQIIQSSEQSPSYSYSFLGILIPIQICFSLFKPEVFHLVTITFSLFCAIPIPFKKYLRHTLSDYSLLTYECHCLVSMFFYFKFYKLVFLI